MKANAAATSAIAIAPRLPVFSAGRGVAVEGLGGLPGFMN
jgi:hypothetical protein